MERDGDRRGDGEGGAGRRQGKPGPEGEPPRGQWKWWQLTVVRDFLEGRRGRGSTARKNPAVTHGRIELFIIMAGCSAHSLCVGVGRVRGPPVRGRILSLLLPLLSTIIPPPLPSLARSILSSRRWTLVSTNTDTGGPLSPLRYITRPALLLRPAPSILLRHHSLPPCPPSRSSPPSSPLRSPRPSLARFFLSFPSSLSSSPRALLQRVQVGPPTPRRIPRWVSNTYLHGRGTTVSVPGQLLTRSTHRDCPRASTGDRTKFIPPPRTTLLHYFERLIRNYYLDRDTNGRKGEGGRGRVCGSCARRRPREEGWF